MIEETASSKASSEAAAPGVSATIAIIVVISMVPLIGALFMAAQLIGVVEFLFAGFLFVLYWTAIKKMALPEFAPALVGSLGGLGLAYLIHALPGLLGTAGIVVAGAGVALAIYLIARGQVPILINNAFMLLLTVGTSRAFGANENYLAAAGAIVLAAAYTGGLVLIGRALMARNSKPAANASAG